MDIQQYSSRRDAETDTGTDWFVGLGLRFTDDTLKSVLPFVPKP